MFEVFKNWCRDNAPGYPPKKGEFRKTVAGLLCMPEEEIEIRTKKARFFTFTLLPEIKSEYGSDIFVRKQMDYD